MANPTGDTAQLEDATLAVRLTRFKIAGLFGYIAHEIHFPAMDAAASEPEVLIVEGQNGTGKTTIMRMIAGMIQLDFDEFRRVPFEYAELELSSGDILNIKYNSDNPEYPLDVEFRDCKASLVADRDKWIYTPEQDQARVRIRQEALAQLRGVDYDFLQIDRYPRNDDKDKNQVRFDPHGNVITRASRPLLAHRVRDFLRDAQVNYRRFFQAEDLDLLPRILKRFASAEEPRNPELLEARVSAVREKNAAMRAFGLQTDDEDLETLSKLMLDQAHRNDTHAMSLIETYVEMHENISRSRQLITDRLTEFQNIMEEFLVGKTVKINVRDGLIITGRTERIKEKDLSSGEYHFLYMMVAALLCQRGGTILAIDEPELSLHVSWQRRLVSALARCARGAAPLFFLATHSTAISAQHADKVVTLSAID